MITALAQTDPDQNSQDLRAETQGDVTFYHSLSTPGYWFSAGELEAMIDHQLFVELEDRNDPFDLDEEFIRGPVRCPRCGDSKLFEMRSYLSPDVRLKACHVCHGRWIGHQSLLLLMDHMRYSGLLGALKRLFARAPARPAQAIRVHG